MENASKALLIAAAVLIVILIVAVTLRVFNSAASTEDSISEAGESISSSTKSASKELAFILENIKSKNLAEVKDHTLKINGWYSNYTPNPKVILEPNTTYKLTFDYKIISADGRVGCGIGYGENTYEKDIVYSVKYGKAQEEGEKPQEGTFSTTITTKSSFDYTNRSGVKVIVKAPYLRIRFARLDSPGDLNVEISNVAFRKVE